MTTTSARSDPAPPAARRSIPVPNPRGGRYVLLLVATGAATVLLVRACLALTGYPQVGGGGLHIAHALWGGLLMAAAVFWALMFTGRTSRMWTALLGGVGLGLFIDEVGKLVTATNNYFFGPAAALMYVVFTLITAASFLMGRSARDTPEAAVADAALRAAQGLESGLTTAERHACLDALAGRDDEAARAVAALLAAAPARPERRRPRSGAGRWAARTAAAADDRRVLAGLLALYLISAFIVVPILLTTALTAPHLRVAAAAGGASRAVALAVLVTSTVAALRRRPWALTGFRLAVLIDLLVSVVFSFADSRFAAVFELPFLFLLLSLLGRHRAVREPRGR